MSGFFGTEKIFDNPLEVGRVYESKVSLKVAVNEFHPQNNFECKVKYNKHRRFFVVCKGSTCIFKLLVKPRGLSEFWIISKQAIPHACKVLSSRTYHNRDDCGVDNTMRKNICASINHIWDIFNITYSKVTPKYKIIQRY